MRIYISKREVYIENPTEKAMDIVEDFSENMDLVESEISNCYKGIDFIVYKGTNFNCFRLLCTLVDRCDMAIVVAKDYRIPDRVRNM